MYRNLMYRKKHVPDGANVHNFRRTRQVAPTFPTTLCRELCKKTVQPIDLLFGLWARVGRRKHKFNHVLQVAPLCSTAGRMTTLKESPF